MNREEWCKEVKIELIRRNMSVRQLARKLGRSHTYVYRALQGHTYRKQACQDISDYLEIENYNE